MVKVRGDWVGSAPEIEILGEVDLVDVAECSCLLEFEGEIAS